jgi:hypothetical protein
MPYLTPARFREMGFGIDISELDDTELASLITQASAVVDSYCNVPRIPQKHDFRGGVITGEQHRWRYPSSPFEIGQRKYYPFHWPVLSVEQFRIYVTNTQYVEIGADSLLINNSERYWEVVSLALTSSGLFNALVIPNVGLADPLATANYTYGWDFTILDEQLTCTDGQTWRAQNQFWFNDTGREPVVRVNDVVVDPQVTPYAVDAYEGTIVFEENLVATDRVNVDYHHKLPTDIQMGTGHIVAHLHGQAELHARGMAHLTRLRVAEVEMDRRDPKMGSSGSLSELLDVLVPEAAVLLGGYRNDNLTVR